MITNNTSNESLAITDAQEEYLIDWLSQRGLTLAQAEEILKCEGRPSFGDVLTLATLVERTKL